MKVQFLSTLGLCLLGLGAQAQWVTQPIAFTADAGGVRIDAVDANTAWSLGVPLFATSYQAAQVARTINAGQTWTVSNLPLNLANQEETTAFAAANATTAWVTTFGGTAGGGRILRTTDGGATWAVQSNASIYAGTDSYPDLIHFFSATEGITIGDAPSSGLPMEMYTTTNGGVTWTPLTTSPPTTGTEYPVTSAPAVVGNHIWFATNRGRVFHSPNKGLTWTTAAIGAGLIDPTSISFRDAQNGLVVFVDDASLNHLLYRTTDGGATWAPVSYNGPLHGLSISNVPGTNQFVSVGADIGNGDSGSSYSRDNGQTWVALESTINHISTEFVSPTVGWSSGFQTSSGQVGAIANRFSSTALSTRTDAALQAGLRVWPNPAVGGRFTLQSARATGGAATVRVLDVAGRQISQQPWAGTAPLALDLSAEPAGLYVLEIQGASGTARQKVVVQ